MIFMVDGQKEDRLKKLRKIIHCLEEMEETIKRLREKVNTNEEVNSEGGRSLSLSLSCTVGGWLSMCWCVCVWVCDSTISYFTFSELKMEREKLLEAIQYVITFKKTMLAIFDAKKFPAANMDVEILSDSRKYFRILPIFMIAFKQNKDYLLTLPNFQQN